MEMIGEFPAAFKVSGICRALVKSRRPSTAGRTPRGKVHRDLMKRRKLYPMADPILADPPQP